jgi:hypothetical protein
MHRWLIAAGYNPRPICINIKPICEIVEETKTPLTELFTNSHSIAVKADTEPMINIKGKLAD